MLKSSKSLVVAVALMAFAATGCTRIGTGEVGVRVDAYKQIQQGELQAGSIAQTFWGDVLTFPVKDITVNIENKTPLTADNSALSDFDLTAVYGINPSSVAELYSTKAKSFHASSDGDILLMQNYIATLLNNATYKVVREYNALQVADKRAEIEQKILAVVNEQLVTEKLANSVNITVIQVRNIQANAEILKSATEYVRAQNELKIKATEVEIAKKESERMAALSANSTTSIAYMQAQSQLLIAQGIKEGKVNTIVVPVDFKGMVNVGK